MVVDVAAAGEVEDISEAVAADGVVVVKESATVGKVV